ncbi:hypothetical protein C8Q76DRAFT_184467 [Earliella scabrosa]|nr:hypothetical protein C8Q76DRAFT_184467 [Earliella scabrosa]
MSIRLLQHPEIPATIPDELESFLHALIYPAVCRVRHNFKDIQGFIASYFDDYLLDCNGRLTCPAVKDTCIREAKLRVGLKYLQFCDEGGSAKRHPLNGLVRTLLHYFQARYKVLRWNEHKDAQQTPMENIENSGSGCASSSTHLLDRLSEQAPCGSTALNPDEEEYDIEIFDDVESESEPSEEESKRARKLDTHVTIRKIFAHFLDAPKYKWPSNDTVPDRLEGFVPRACEDAADPDVPETSKRPRTGPKPAAEARALPRNAAKASGSRS